MYKRITNSQVTISDSELLRRREENREYLMRLRTDNLLLNHSLEAGVSTGYGDFDYSKIHGGWESPTCQLRGHFVGHWISAAAKHYAATGNNVLKARVDEIVDNLAYYQKLNGGQ